MIKKQTVIGLFTTILTITVFVNLYSLNIINNLPIDMNLAWGTVVLLGIASSLYFLTVGDSS